LSSYVWAQPVETATTHARMNATPIAALFIVVSSL
jgi:hypothetical protein